MKLEIQDKLIIPQKIKVGLQKRKSTYTGNLAYIIYWDSKGVLRKETSWQNWRDKSIEPLEFENVPTSGFVINKKVGGYNTGWNHRDTYVRIFDPRGFEFEIDVTNLLFILQECTATKGKGLEGEFVYSWDGKDLILLPVTSQDYQKSNNFTKLQSLKVTKEMMVAGRLYKFKNNDVYMYLGRHPYVVEKIETVKVRRKVQAWSSQEILAKSHKYFTTEMKHIFIKIEDINKSEYRIEKGFTNIGQIVSQEIDDNYSEQLDIFLKSKYSSLPVAIKENFIIFCKGNESWENFDFFVKIDERTYLKMYVHGNNLNRNQVFFSRGYIFKNNVWNEFYRYYPEFESIYKNFISLKGIHASADYFDIDFESFEKDLLQLKFVLSSGETVNI